MKGSIEVHKVTGEYTVYPGHPVVIAWEIMSTKPHEQLRSWSSFLADNDISGGRTEVQSGTLLLRRAMEGESLEKLFLEFDESWRSGNAGGHVKMVAPGQVQADVIKPLFREKLDAWMRTAEPVPQAQ